MSLSPAHLANLQLELAMALSSSLDLDVVLRQVLTTLMRRVDARSGAFYAWHSDGDVAALRLSLAIPRVHIPELDDQLRAFAAQARRPDAEACAVHALDDDTRYLFAVPGYGVLDLRKRGVALGEPTLRCLCTIFVRLGLIAKAAGAHAELRASEARFAALVTRLPEVVFEGLVGPDASLRLDYVSPRSADVLGVEPGEILGDPRLLIAGAGDEHMLRLELALVGICSTMTPLELVVPVRRADGERWLMLVANAHRQPNGVVRVSGLVQDVTARERLAHAERSASDARLSTLLSSVSDAIVGADREGMITHWNRGAERLFGHGADRAIGAPLTLIIPPNMRSAHAAGMREHLASGRTRVVGRPVEMEACHADGRVFPVELLVNRVDDGGRIEFVGIIRDLSQRRARELEQALITENERKFGRALVDISAHTPDDLGVFLANAARVIAHTLTAARLGIWRYRDHALACSVLVEDGIVDSAPNIDLVSLAQQPSYATFLQGKEPRVERQPSRTHLEQRNLASVTDGVRFATALHVPLRTLDTLLGVVCVEWLEGRPAPAGDVRFAEDAAALIVQALERWERLRLEARHSVVLGAIGDGVIACDARGRVTLMNPVAEALTGVAEYEALGRPVDEVAQTLDPRSGQRLTLPVWHVVQTGRALGVLTPSLLQGPDGAATPISSRVAPIIDEGGATGCVVTFRDVSDEVAAHRALAHQNLYLRALGEAIPDLLFTVRPDGTLRYAQQADSPDLLVSPDRVTEHTVQQIFDPDLSTKMIAAIRRAVENGGVQTVEYSLDFDGNERLFEARIARMADDEAVVLVRNVTSDRLRERALEVERARLAQVLGATSAIIHAGTVAEVAPSYFSESARAVLGYGAEVLSDPEFWRQQVHPDDLRGLLRRRAALPGDGRQVNEYRFRHADGRYRWLRDEIRAVGDAGADGPSVVGAAFDITSRKQSELRLHVLLSIQQFVARVSARFLTRSYGSRTVLVREILAGVGRLAAASQVLLLTLDDAWAEQTERWDVAGGDAVNDALAPARPATRAPALIAHLRSEGAVFVAAGETHEDPLGAERSALLDGRHESLLVVPVAVDGVVTRALALGSPSVDPLEPTELAALMQLLADTLAAGLQRVADETALRRLNRRLRRQARGQRVLLRLSTLLAASTSRGELLAHARGHLKQAFHGARVSLAEKVDDRHFRLVVMDSEGEPDGVEADVRQARAMRELEGSAVSRAFATHRTISTREFGVDEFRDWSFLSLHTPMRSFVVVPVGRVGEPPRTLNIGFESTRPPTATTIAWAEQFGSLLSAHLAIREANDALEALNSALEERVVERTRELRASERRFEQLFVFAPQAMVIVDRAGQIVQANDNAHTMFADSARRLGGMSVSKLVPLPVRERHEQWMREQVAGRREKEAGRVVQALRLDQTSFSAEIKLVPIDINGEPHTLAGITDISQRLAAQEAVSRSLAEKETLLKEVHHRVKNNLQIISSLLMLQSDSMPTEHTRSLLHESVFRVRSMALIHEQLYGVESLERIDLADYARSLSTSLGSALAPTARVSVRADRVELKVDVAVPLGLILNELLTNAFKYGTRKDPPPGAVTEPDITVDVRVDARELQMCVADSGPGLPPDFEIARTRSLGFQLVRSLVRQLRGRLDVGSGPGARFTVVIAAPSGEPTT